MSPNQIYVLTPMFACDARLAIAANRAGSVGVLDIGDRFDLQAEEQIRFLRQHVRNPRRWCVRLSAGSSGSQIDRLQRDDDRTKLIPALILADLSSSSDELKAAVATGRTVARHLICEVYSVEQAHQAAAAGFDRVLVKASACACSTE